MTKHKRFLIPAALIGLLALACSVIASAEPDHEETLTLTTVASTTTTIDSEYLAAKRSEDNLNKWMDAVEQNNIKTWVWVTNTRLRETWIANTNAAIEAQRRANERAAAAKKAEEQRRVNPDVPSRSAEPAPSGSGVCNGVDLPPCYVVQRESGFNPQAKNPSSSACGLYQFITSTWANFGGYPNACSAPASVQVAKARIVWDHGRGCGHWSAC